MGSAKPHSSRESIKRYNASGRHIFRGSRPTAVPLQWKQVTAPSCLRPTGSVSGGRTDTWSPLIMAFAPSFNSIMHPGEAGSKQALSTGISTVAGLYVGNGGRQFFAPSPSPPTLHKCQAHSGPKWAFLIMEPSPCCLLTLCHWGGALCDNVYNILGRMYAFIFFLDSTLEEKQ